MDVNILRELFRAGALKGAHVVPALMTEDSWGIIVDHIIDGKGYVTTLKGEEKHYKSLPAAMEDVRRIGFREVLTTLPESGVPIKR